MAEDKLTNHTGLRYTDEEATMIDEFRAEFPGMSRNLAMRTLMRLGFKASGLTAPATAPAVPDGQERIEMED